jgi:hypothetical protein
LRLFIILTCLWCLEEYIPSHQLSYSPTNLPIYLPTHLTTHLLTYLHTYTPTYPITYPTHPPNDLPTYLFSHPPTYLPTHPQTYTCIMLMSICSNTLPVLFIMYQQLYPSIRRGWSSNIASYHWSVDCNITDVCGSNPSFFILITTAHHDRSICERVIALIEGVGLSASAAGERYDIPGSTARASVQKYRTDGRVGRRQGSGLWRVSSAAKDAALVAEARRNPFASARELKAATTFSGQKRTFTSRLK